MALGTARGELARLTLSSLSWQMLANGVRFVANFGIGISLARLLPPEDFGLVGIALIFTGFAEVLVGLGLSYTIIQRKTVTDRLIRLCHTLSTTMAILIAASLYFGAGRIAAIFDDTRVEGVLETLAFLFVFSAFGATSAALMARRLAFRTAVKIEVFSSVIGYGGVAITMASMGYGYWSLISGIFTQTIASSFLKYSVERHSLLPLISRTESSDIFHFSAGMFLASTANYFARQGDFFVVGKFMGAQSLGFYSRAFAFMELPQTFLGSAISHVLFPAASRMQDDLEQLKKTFLAALFLSIAISLPLSLSIAMLAPELIQTLYGREWTAAIPILRILGFFGVVRTSATVAMMFVQARGNSHHVLLILTVYGGLVFGGSWWAATVAGLEEVAWALGGALFAMWTLAVGFANKALAVSLKPFLRECLLATIPGLAGGLALFPLIQGVRAAGTPAWATLTLAGAAFGAVGLWALVHSARHIDHPALNKEMEWFLSKIPFYRLKFGPEKHNENTPLH